MFIFQIQQVIWRVPKINSKTSACNFLRFFNFYRDWILFKLYIYVMIKQPIILNKMITVTTSDEHDQIPQQTKTYKTFWRFFFNVIAICCGSFFFGYNFTYFSIYPIEQIRTNFHIRLSASNTKGILNAMIPAGALLGAFLSSFLLRYLSRRISLLIVCTVGICGGSFTLVSSFVPMATGRFLEGISVGLYSSICPVFINQLVPSQLSGFFGTFHQIFIVLGVITTNVLTLAISENNYQGAEMTSGWKLIFGIPIMVAFFQAIILIFIFDNQTPKYLLIVGKIQETHRLLQQLYLPQYVDIIYQKLQKQIKVKLKNQNELNNQAKFQISTRKKESKLAVLMGFHIALLQQYSGTNLISIYCGDIFNQVLSASSVKPCRILLQTVKLAGCFGATYLIRKLGRKTLIQLGAFSLGLILLIISICRTSNNLISNYLVIGCLFIYMMMFGFTLGPVVWMNIPEFVKAKWVPYTTMANWGGSMTIVFLFPVVKSIMGTQVYFFLMLSGLCFGSYVINKMFLVQTKNKSRQQINLEYHAKFQ